MKEVFNRSQLIKSSTEKPITVQELKMEINALKVEIKHLQTSNLMVQSQIKKINNQIQDKPKNEEQDPDYLMLLNKVTFQKWYIRITFIIQPDYIIRDAIALVDSGADMNCIQEGLVPTKYFQKTS